LLSLVRLTAETNVCEKGNYMSREKIRMAVQEVNDKSLPQEKVVLEYNFEVPSGFKKDSFYGIKARYNSMVAKGECKITYTY